MHAMRRTSRPPRRPLHAPPARARRRGLTLIELVAAAAVGAIVASAALGVMSRLLRAREATIARVEAADRAHAGAAAIAEDLLHVARDHDLAMTRLVITDAGSPDAPRDELLLLSRTLRRVRPIEEEPFAGEVEVQYRIAPATGPDDPDALWRRADHAFDPARDGGGLAAPLAPAVVALDLSAFDGSEWFSAWDSDASGLPHAVRVVVTARSEAHSAGVPARATARRIVAIDRVPLPASPPSDEQQSESTPSGTAPGDADEEPQNDAPARGGAPGGGGGRGGGGGGGFGGGGGGAG